MHELRGSWRMMSMHAWLRRESRRESQFGFGRDEGLIIIEAMLNKPRKLVKTADGHFVALMTGGMSTENVTAQFASFSVP